MVTTSDWKPKYNALVGVIGGIGPAASSRLFQYVVEMRVCESDEGHIPLLIFNNPQIPNNNKAALGTGPPSIPGMEYTARALKHAGATHIVIPCNTAHIFIAELQRKLHPLPIINMLNLTRDAVHEALTTALPDLDGGYRVGLMGTIGTIRSEVYHTAFQGTTATIDIVCPSESGQERIQDCIWKVKAGNARSECVERVLLAEAQALVERGVHLIVLGCTELPLVLTPDCVDRLSVPVVDPMRVLAAEVIRVTESS